MTTILVVTHNQMIADNSKTSWKLEDGRITGLYKGIDVKLPKDVKKPFYVSVDNQGNLRIPKDILEKSQIKNSAVVEFNDKTRRVEIRPD